MRVSIGVTVASFLVVFVVGCGTPTQPGPITPRDLQVFEDQAGFDQAVNGLGSRALIDFEDINAGPVSNTITGRPPFDPLRYANRGVSFLSSGGVPLFIAPGGLFWNPTNSLSVGRFPFDSGPDGPQDADDDLAVLFDPGCIAAAFSTLDKGDMTSEDFVDFYDHENRRLRLVGFPRTFLGMVAPISPSLVQYRISRIVISETGNDGDDVNYDNFICIR